MNDETQHLLRHPDHKIVLNELDIFVRNGVFSPDPLLTNSTSILLRHIPDVTGKTVLDLGSGTGIIAIRCAMNGAQRVVASEINPVAIDNLHENIQHHRVNERIEIRQSDLFTQIPETFDCILANLPIVDTVWSQEEGAAQRLVERFILEAPNHLTEGGKACLTWNSFCDMKSLRNALAASPFHVKEFREETLGCTWYLFELTKA